MYQYRYIPHLTEEEKRDMQEWAEMMLEKMMTDEEKKSASRSSLRKVSQMEEFPPKQDDMDEFLRSRMMENDLSSIPPPPIMTDEDDCDEDAGFLFDAGLSDPAEGRTEVFRQEDAPSGGRDAIDDLLDEIESV